MSETKLDKGWDDLEKQHHIVEEVHQKGYMDIRADTIKKVCEPRLMTKFDHEEELPELFKKAHLSIMPITRGIYRICQDEMFHKIEKDAFEGSVTQMPIPSQISCIRKDAITSEATALNIAYDCGIISDFINDGIIFPASSGRQGSAAFDFKMKKYDSESYDELSVKKAQLEIDAAYESQNYYSIIEAKIGNCSNFLIRQLYYPYRKFYPLVRGKPINLIFFTYSNSTFHLLRYTYRPEEILFYNNIAFSGSKAYQIGNEKITKDDVLKIYYNVPIKRDPLNIPYPQADRFDRVISTLENCANEPKTTSEIAGCIGVTAERQSYYYSDAAIYLGLMNKETTEDGFAGYQTNEQGKAVLGSSYKERQLAFTKLILSLESFHLCFKKRLEKGQKVSEKEAVLILLSLGIPIKSSTLSRRAQTLTGWIEWIVSLYQKED
jgi:hypothetical protein